MEETSTHKHVFFPLYELRFRTVSHCVPFTGNFRNSELHVYTDWKRVYLHVRATISSSAKATNWWKFYSYQVLFLSWTYSGSPCPLHGWTVSQEAAKHPCLLSKDRRKLWFSLEKESDRGKQGHNLGFMGEWEWESKDRLCCRSNCSRLLVSAYSSDSPYPVALCWKMSSAPFSELLCISQDKCPLAGKNNSGNQTKQSSLGSLWWWRLLPGELQKHL